VKTPRKAFILAAGLGTRLRPLTDHTPKPLLPLWNIPLVFHTLALLKKWGVREVLVNLHHGADAIFNTLRTHGAGGMQMSFSFEPEILGTGGAVRRAQWFFDDEPFWMLNADIAIDLSPAPLMKDFQAHQPLATLWMHAENGPRTVEMAQDGCIRNFRSSTPKAPGTFTFCGLQLLSPAIFEYLPDRGFSTIIAAYEKALQAGKLVRGVATKNVFWADAGTPQDYLDTHARVLEAYCKGIAGSRLMSPPAYRRMAALEKNGIHIQGFAAVADHARIGAGSRLKNTVIWNQATIRPNSQIEDAIIGTRACVQNLSRQIALCADHITASAVQKAITAMGWPCTGTTVLPMAPRGSARQFFRLSRAQKSVILVTYSMERPENARFAGHARFLASRGIAAPAILHDNPDGHWTIMEDFGDTSLLDLVQKATGRQVYHYYHRVLPLVVRLHQCTPAILKRANIKMEEPFSPALYQWEHNLFATHFLGGLLKWNTRRTRQLLDSCRMLPPKLAGQPPVLVHRDLQSTNILFSRRGLALIDFQGMRPGPAAYDMASLLCDPYVAMEENVQQQLLRHYATLAGTHGDELHAIFPYAAAQRLIQALGAYARLGAQPATRRFLRHIPAGLDMLLRTIKPVAALGSLYNAMNGVREEFEKMPFVESVFQTDS